MTANLAYVEVLTCGEDALTPCLMLSIERRAAYGTSTTVLRRYLFDVPEEIVRFCGSHQLKLGKFAAAFTTAGSGAAGLPELILACAEQGLPSLHIRGPRGVVEYTKTITETLGNPRAMKVLTAEAKSSDPLCYEDEHLCVWAVPAPPARGGTRAGCRGADGQAPPPNRASLCWLQVPIEGWRRRPHRVARRLRPPRRRRRHRLRGVRLSPRGATSRGGRQQPGDRGLLPGPKERFVEVKRETCQVESPCVPVSAASAVGKYFEQGQGGLGSGIARIFEACCLVGARPAGARGTCDFVPRDD